MTTSKQDCSIKQCDCGAELPMMLGTDTPYECGCGKRWVKMIPLGWRPPFWAPDVGDRVDGGEAGQAREAHGD